MILKSTLAALAIAGITHLGMAQAAFSPLTAQADVSAPTADTNVQIAREAGSRGRGRGRDDARGHSNVDESAMDEALIAREAGSRGRGRGRDDGRGHSHVDDDTPQTLLMAREASERPRGQDNERPGDRQRRNRGGRG